MAVMAHHPMTNCQAAALPRGTGHGGLIEEIRGIVGVWRGRIRDRRTFASLDQRDLHDVGATRWDVERELAKPFWRG